MIAVIVAMLLLTAVAGKARAEVVRGSLRLKTYATEHFHVHTNLSKREAAPIGRHMDEVYNQLNRRFAKYPTKRKTKPQLFLLDSEEQYHALLKSHGVRAANTSGIFVIQPTIEGVLVWTRGVKPSRIHRVLQHEGFHQFAANRLGHDLPIWLNEGVAEYFEEGLLVDGKLTLGQISAKRLRALRQAMMSGRLIPLEQLLAMSNSRWGLTLARDQGRAAVLYDQSWSLVHFLVHGDNGKHRAALDALIQKLADDVPTQQAIDETLGRIGIGKLDLAWRKFLSDAKPSPISQATLHMQFLAEGLKVLQENRRDMPQTMKRLRGELSAINLRTRMTHNGVTIRFNGEDASLYRYSHPDRGSTPFLVVQSPRPDMPATLRAPGLNPEPRLVWSLDRKGKLMHDFEYVAAPKLATRRTVSPTHRVLTVGDR